MSHSDFRVADSGLEHLTRRQAITLLLATASCPLLAQAGVPESAAGPAVGVRALACHAPSDVAHYLPILAAAQNSGELWQSV